MKASRGRRIRRLRMPAGFTLIELLVVISIVVILLGLLVPAVQMSREASRRVQCMNNVRQLALAVQLFENSHRSYPAGGWGKLWAGVPDMGLGPNQPGGWIYQVLPNLEQAALFSLGGSNGIDAQQNSRRLSTPLPVLHCPSRRAAELYHNEKPWIPQLHALVPALARNDYAMNGGSVLVRYGNGPANLAEATDFAWPSMSQNNGLCYQRSRVKVGQVTDGLSHTYLLGEKQIPHEHYYSGQEWGDNESAYGGDDRDLTRFTGWEHAPLSDFQAPFPFHDPLGGSSFGSPHSIFHMAFADGSVAAVSYSIDAKVHRLHGDKADGES
jgi:prepilin-type N-terminal cleavage/methylation domain-containing protein